MTPRNLITTEATIGRRCEARLRVRLEARLITTDKTCRCVLADVSTHGARLIGPGLDLRPGQEAVLQWAGLEAFGIVVWKAEGQCGLCFYDTLDPRMILAIRRMEEQGGLPDELEMVRRSARAFVQGGPRT